jgi:hypothetical protein
MRTVSREANAVVFYKQGKPVISLQKDDGSHFCVGVFDYIA